MNAAVGEPTIEEEEDVSRGDALDLVTPREISRMRYEQHHEWMEEIVESAYNINQIIPSDLGLGRKGELESLTRGFFEAPLSAAHPTTNGAPARVGKMHAGKAAEFTKLAAQKVADMQKELEELKAKHARRMEKLQQISVLAAAEKKATHRPMTVAILVMEEKSKSQEQAQTILCEMWRLHGVVRLTECRTSSSCKEADSRIQLPDCNQACLQGP